MRIRHKKWARPELEACPYFQQDPESLIGKWRDIFSNPSNPLYLELGAGKGYFVAELGPKMPKVNFLAIDLKSDILGVARRNVEMAYGETPVENLQMTAWDIERLDLILSPKDQIDRVFINFCNPWPKRGEWKHRLTYPKQLEKYKSVMKKEAEIVFKTDDDDLFSDSIEYLKETGFEITNLVFDLHKDGIPNGYESPETEHEKMFSAEGIPIKFLTAKQKA